MFRQRRIAVALLVAVSLVGCKKAAPAEQTVAQSPPASAPTQLDSPVDPQAPQSTTGSDNPDPKMKPTYDLLAAARERPIELLASAFDLGLTAAQIDEIANSPDRQSFSVAGSDGKLILTVEDGQFVDVQLATGTTSKPSDEPDDP